MKEEVKELLDCHAESDYLDFKEDNYPKDKKNIVIMGGGNVAIDAARIARRIYDGKVTIIYRRAKEQMPARKDEIRLAEDEYINFSFLTNPIMCYGHKKI